MELVALELLAQAGFVVSVSVRKRTKAEVDSLRASGVRSAALAGVRWSVDVPGIGGVEADGLANALDALVSVLRSKGWDMVADDLKVIMQGRRS